MLLFLPAALVFAGWYVLRPPTTTDDGLVCDWRRKPELQACLTAQFGEVPTADLIASLERAGFRNETRPDEAPLYFRKRAGNLGNYIVVVLIWQDSRGNIEKITVN